VATRTKTTTTSLYEEDFYLWTQRQAELLRQGRFADVDLEHLIEEIEDLGSSQRHAVESHVQNIVHHLLKLQFSPAVPPRHGWEVTVLAQRIQLRRRLTTTLRNHIAANLPQLHADARRLAVKDLRQDSVPADSLPVDCPYTFDQILDSDWLPMNVHGTNGNPSG
jgi:hypothetical protein